MRYYFESSGVEKKRRYEGRCCKFAKIKKKGAKTKSQEVRTVSCHAVLTTDWGVGEGSGTLR